MDCLFFQYKTSNYMSFSYHNLIESKDENISFVVVFLMQQIACKPVPGYYGSFCNITCPPGSYGAGCAGYCPSTCLHNYCHHVYGCLKNITEQTTKITSGKNCVPIFVVNWNVDSVNRKCTSYYNNCFIHNLLLHIKEEHPHSSDVSSISMQQITMLITDKPVKQSEFSKYLLLAVIGITFLIVIVLTMIHLLWKFKDRKKKKRIRERHASACNVNDNVQLPLDPVYNDILGGF